MVVYVFDQSHHAIYRLLANKNGTCANLDNKSWASKSWPTFTDTRPISVGQVRFPTKLAKFCWSSDIAFTLDGTKETTSSKNHYVVMTRSNSITKGIFVWVLRSRRIVINC